VSTDELIAIIYTFFGTRTTVLAGSFMYCSSHSHVFVLIYSNFSLVDRSRNVLSQ
jgi:hypothetical protein